RKYAASVLRMSIGSAPAISFSSCSCRRISSFSDSRQPSAVSFIYLSIRLSASMKNSAPEASASVRAGAELRRAPVGVLHVHRTIEMVGVLVTAGPLVEAFPVGVRDLLVAAVEVLVDGPIFVCVTGITRTPFQNGAISKRLFVEFWGFHTAYP